MHTITPNHKEVREVKCEDGKYFAWNPCRGQWYRIAKSKVVFPA